MPSLDIVSKIDHQSMDNAINVARKEILNRYDFNGTKTTIDFDKKEMSLHIVTENDMRIKAIGDIIIGRAIKQHIEPSCFDFGKELYAAGNMVKKDVKIKEGIDKETAKKIVKDIKETGLKLQASIMDDIVRVTGKKIDDLQDIMSRLKKNSYGQPLQFVNMKS